MRKVKVEMIINYKTTKETQIWILSNIDSIHTLCRLYITCDLLHCHNFSLCRACSLFCSYFKYKKKNHTLYHTQTKTTMSVLVRINKGLGKLYEARGRKDYYLNGKGLFTKYCEEYGYDDKLIEGELKTAADECMLIDFCKEESGQNEDSKDEHDNDCKYNFPFKNQSASIEDQQQIIYETLTSFIINNSRPSTPTEQLPNHKRPIHINLDFQSNDYELTLQLYKKHAYNSLGQHGMNEESLMNLLTISRVNNNFPFMRYLSDSFQRDRIKHHINNETTLTVFKWFKSKKYFQNMSDEKPNKADQTKQAIDGYCNR